ncbi:MAG: type II toxin-antitoxin system RelB/DinJ family antitoxin [Alteromonadaceae bacterium]|nr:type II toxin-antitoxin system RelB/DinJ family antitoxin [Alteromonadaceae bacterium]
MLTIQTRVTDELKIKADALFKDMGLTTTDAVRMFLMQCVNLGQLPFVPTGKKPNAQTLAALNDTLNNEDNRYANIDELSNLWK